MRRVGICSVALLICVCLVSPSHAFFNSDVKKAKEFIKADMYPQAIELLNKRINDKPTDAEAHFILGSCYLHQGDMGRADQRFESAVKLESKYGAEVAAEFQKAGNDSLDQANLRRAQYLHSKAIQYSSGLRSQIAQGCFDRGAASMNIPFFDMAASLDPSFKMKAYSLIMDKVEKITHPKDKIQLYRTALGFNHEAKQPIIEAVVAIAKNQDRRMVEPEIKRFPVDVSAQIMTIVWPPDFVKYKAGEIAEFPPLKAGNYTHFIKTELGTSFDVQYKNGDYEVVTRSGKVYPKGTPISYLQEDFRIHALTDCLVRVVFK